jgi:hypothetical protein
VVRRDEDVGGSGRPVAAACSRFASPAGASPAPVSAGAPGSRSPVRGEIRDAEAGRRKPPRRKPERGPQHEVNPAASTEKQSGGRADHVTAKATPLARAPVRAVGSCGVWGAARVQGEARNTRDPSALPSSRQSAPYKSMTKSAAAQRESEGAVVVTIAAANNAVGAKGPCFDRAEGTGTCEGMAATSGPNDPGLRTQHEEARRPGSQHGPVAKVGASAGGSSSNVTGVTPRGATRTASFADTARLDADRSPVSGVREIRTHGLKGGPALSPVLNIR